MALKCFPLSLPPCLPPQEHGPLLKYFLSEQNHIKGSQNILQREKPISHDLAQYFLNLLDNSPMFHGLVILLNPVC